jgi:thymidylate synthase
VNRTLHIWKVTIVESYDYGSGRQSERKIEYVSTESASVDDLSASVEAMKSNPHSCRLVVDASNPVVYLGMVHRLPDIDRLA